MIPSTSSGEPTEVSTSATTTPLWRALAPICAIVFLEFLAMGLPLPVLPIYVQEQLQLGSMAVAIVIGAQAWATLLTRHAAGTRSDQRGPRSATALGLALSALAGLAYASSSSITNGSASLAMLLAGRAVLGVGESLVIAGALAWGIALAGREHSGVVMSWIGIAMYGALASGAPLGSMLETRFGFAGMSIATALAPLSAFVALALARNVKPAGGARIPFYRVLGMIWLPGAGLTLGALGFGAIATFATLRFQAEGWSHAPLAMTAFGAAYVLARMFLGWLPDRFGGARIAMVSAAVAALGQLGMWLASSSATAVIAAALTGLGFSLAFPAFGVEAVRRVPAQNRGVALGAYAACVDLTMGIGVPLLGAAVSLYGERAAFAVGAGAALASLLIASVLGQSAQRSAS